MQKKAFKLQSTLWDRSIFSFRIYIKYIFTTSTSIDIYIYIKLSVFGGLVVSMLASGTQDRGFDPG